MPHIHLGIAYEGELDIEPVQILIERILEPLCQITIKRKISPHTCIIGYVSSYTTIFFVQDCVDIAIYLTDQDESSDDRRGQVIEKIRKVNPLYLDFSAIGICDPHFEKWLIVDHNTAKKVFKIENHSVPLPHNDKTPKYQIATLKNVMKDNQPSLHEVYNSLARELDIDFVRTNCLDFNVFCENLIEVCKNCLRNKENSKHN